MMRIALLSMMKGIIGARTGGRSPDESAIMLGIRPTRIAAWAPRVAAAMKRVALTIGPVIGWKWNNGTTVAAPIKAANLMSERMLTLLNVRVDVLCMFFS